MAGEKESYQIDLNPNQMTFVRNAQEKYNIPDESKVLRIVMDYLMNDPSIHDAVFSEIRCMRCE